MYPLRYLMMIPMTAFAVLTACSSNVKKAELPADANAQTEISRLNEDMAQARRDNVDVASPQNYNKADKAMSKAKSLAEREKDREDILEQVAISRGYLNEATSRATTTKEQLSDLLKARSEAKTAKAEVYFKSQFADVDRQLESETWNFEKGKGDLSQKKREALQQSYMNLESKALQKTHLGDARALIDNAEKNGAKKYAPRSLASAKVKLKSAERIIDTNRHDETAIQAATNDATAEARKLVLVNQNARKANGLSAEEVALSMTAKDLELQSASEQINRREEALQESASEKEAALAEKDSEIQAQEAALATATQQKSELEKRDTFNQTLADAQKEFSKDEAEVYRQGDSLLIRLKAGTFASGSADLASPAFATLNKVNAVVSKVGADKVIVEGHTDSTGSKAVNQELSEKRAKTVADFIASSKVVEQDQIEAEGLGFEKPVAPNSTREGRAQNRRVDIIITPKAIE